MLKITAAAALASLATLALADDPIVIDPITGDFLGVVNDNPYDPDSIANPYGQYGSRYSTDSINNPYGDHGIGDTGTGYPVYEYDSPYNDAPLLSDDDWN